MNKKGQAAMEFLMTYGWAILVVLAAIAALAYFGVLSPDRFLPEKCTLPSGVACLDSTATVAGITLVIQNSAGFDMSDVAVSTAGTGCSVAATGATDLKNGDKATYTAACALSSGTKYKGTLSVQYTNVDTSLAHNASGDIIKRVP